MSVDDMQRFVDDEDTDFVAMYEKYHDKMTKKQKTNTKEKEKLGKAKETEQELKKQEEEALKRREEALVAAEDTRQHHMTTTVKQISSLLLRLCSSLSSVPDMRTNFVFTSADQHCCVDKAAAKFHRATIDAIREEQGTEIAPISTIHGVLQKEHDGTLRLCESVAMSMWGSELFCEVLRQRLKEELQVVKWVSSFSLSFSLSLSLFPSKRISSEIFQYKVDLLPTIPWPRITGSTTTSGPRRPRSTT
jgi:hypothetical protein